MSLTLTLLTALPTTYFRFGGWRYTLYVLNNQNHCYTPKLNDFIIHCVKTRPIFTLYICFIENLIRLLSGFHGAFATGVARQQGTLTLPDTWFRPPIWDLLMLQFMRPNSSNLPCLYSTFYLEYPLVLSRFCFHDLTKNYADAELHRRQNEYS